MVSSDDKCLIESVKICIKSFREENGFTQDQLAKIIGVSRTTYTKWESGDTLPNIIQLSKLAAIYGVDLDRFLKAEVNLRVASPDYEDEYGDNYVSELNDEERYFLANFRLLNRNDKNKLLDYIESIKE